MGRTESSAPTKNIVPLRNQRCLFSHCRRDTARRGRRALRRNRFHPQPTHPFNYCCRDTGRRGRRPLRRAGRLLCHQRCLLSNPPPWARAEQSPAPTKNMVPLRNHRCRFSHPLLSKAGHAGPALRRNRAHPQPTCPFNDCRPVMGRRGRRPLRRTGHPPGHQRRFFTNAPPGCGRFMKRPYGANRQPGRFAAWRRDKNKKTGA